MFLKFKYLDDEATTAEMTRAELLSNARTFSGSRQHLLTDYLKNIPKRELHGHGFHLPVYSDVQGLCAIVRKVLSR